MDERTTTRLDRRGIGRGAIAVVILLVLVYVGSEGLRWFDAALAPYLFGTLLAAFATVYRYTVWLRRPPTARLNRRGWEALRARGRLGSNLVALGGMLVTNLALQRFIAPRSRTRWLAHQLLFWGCVLAALVTFPLTFGWIHFESADASGRTYLAYFGPLATITFDSRSLLGWLVFHLLNIAAVLVIAGVAIFLVRRLPDAGGGHAHGAGFRDQSARRDRLPGLAAAPATVSPADRAGRVVHSTPSLAAFPPRRHCSPGWLWSEQRWCWLGADRRGERSTPSWSSAPPSSPYPVPVRCSSGPSAALVSGAPRRGPARPATGPALGDVA